jgi:Mrp family chromosome partitioning ATPase
MQALLKDARSKFEWVLVDTPPLASTADAGLLCPLVDAALLVVRAGRTPLASVRQAIEALGRERILGVVLNGSTEAVASDYNSLPLGSAMDEGRTFGVLSAAPRS